MCPCVCYAPVPIMGDVQPVREKRYFLTVVVNRAVIVDKACDAEVSRCMDMFRCDREAMSHGSCEFTLR